MTPTDRDKVLARIKALFSKTVEAGATEAEELAAAGKARELIEQYQINLGAEELRREGFITKTLEQDRAQFVFSRYIMNAVGKFCEVETWYLGWVQRIEIMGLASDAEFATYLFESLTNFALAGADLHAAMERKMAIACGSPLQSSESKEVRRSYLLGCADRISARLNEMARERRTRVAKPGSYGALIKLDKPQLIRAEMERLGIRVHRGSGTTGAGHSEAFAAGSAHGAKATFGRPVAGGRVAGQIERK